MSHHDWIVLMRFLAMATLLMSVVLTLDGNRPWQRFMVIPAVLSVIAIWAFSDLARSSP